MTSFWVPDEQDVYVVWAPNGPSLAALRTVKLTVPELAEVTVAELYSLATGRPEFHVGRFEYLRALELRWRLEEGGLTTRLD